MITQEEAKRAARLCVEAGVFIQGIPGEGNDVELEFPFGEFSYAYTSTEGYGDVVIHGGVESGGDLKVSLSFSMDPMIRLAEFQSLCLALSRVGKEKAETDYNIRKLVRSWDQGRKEEPR